MAWVCLGHMARSGGAALSGSPLPDQARRRVPPPACDHSRRVSRESGLPGFLPCRLSDRAAQRFPDSSNLPSTVAESGARARSIAQPVWRVPRAAARAHDLRQAATRAPAIVLAARAVAPAERARPRIISPAPTLLVDAT